VLKFWLGDSGPSYDLKEQYFDLHSLSGRAAADNFGRELVKSIPVFQAGDESRIVSFLKDSCRMIGITGWDSQVEELVRTTLKDPRLKEAFAPVNDNCLQLYTLHKSKGLEFDVVVHLDCHEWVLPGFQSLNEGTPDDVRDAALRQDLNLHYVGITRARKAVYLVYQKTRHRSDGQARQAERSRFLDASLRPLAMVLPPYPQSM
jgi:DNA helicase-2/ATP-dependent DNA helicase PcrA